MPPPTVLHKAALWVTPPCAGTLGAHLARVKTHTPMQKFRPSRGVERPTMTCRSFPAWASRVNWATTGNFSDQDKHSRSRLITKSCSATSKYGCSGRLMTSSERYSAVLSPSGLTGKES